MSSLQYTTTVRASILVNTHPFILTLVFCILRRPLGRLTVAGMIVCCAGLLLSESPAAIDGGSGDAESGKPAGQLLTGDFLALVAGGTKPETFSVVYFFPST